MICRHQSNSILPFIHTDVEEIQKASSALAGVAQWIERQPVNQRVATLIPNQGTGLGCGPGPR